MTSVVRQAKWTGMMYFLSTLASVNCQNACIVVWAIVPTSGTMINCNIINQGVTIVSLCTVKTLTNVTIHWYYSQQRDSAGLRGTQLPDNVHAGAISSVCRIIANIMLCTAELTITDVETVDEGYYWCEVDEQDTLGLVQQPSSVLRITGCDTLESCQRSQSFRTNFNNMFGCAAEVGTTRNNFTFVDLYSENCPTPHDIAKEINSTTEFQLLTTEMTTTKFIKPKPDIMTTAMISSLAVASSVNSMTSRSEIVVRTTSSNVGNEGANSLLQRIVWPVVGGVICVLLFLAIMLLLLILRVQCRKERGNDHPENPLHDTVNQESLTDGANIREIEMKNNESYGTREGAVALTRKERSYWRTDESEYEDMSYMN